MQLSHLSRDSADPSSSCMIRAVLICLEMGIALLSASIAKPIRCWSVAETGRWLTGASPATCSRVYCPKSLRLSSNSQSMGLVEPSAQNYASP